MKALFRSIILLSVSAVLFSCGGTAQEETPVKEGPAKAFLVPDSPSDSILIGDRVRYGAEIYDLPAGTFVEMPLQEPMKEFRDSVLALSPWTSDTLRVNPDGSADLRETIVLTAFDKGDFVLPAIEAVTIRPDGGVDTLRLESLILPVRDPYLDPAVFGAEVAEGTRDTNGYGIKPPVDYDVDTGEGRSLLWYVLLIVLLALLCAAAAFFGYRYTARRKEAGRTPLSPREEAMKALDSYDDRAYWAPEKQKALYSGVTGALKKYMKRTYGFDAPEMTSDEVLVSLSANGVARNLIDSLKELFTVADFVKFARHKASDVENASLVPSARAFVEATSEAEPAPEQEKEEAAK